MPEIYELWCLKGPVKYMGEVVFDNFHSFDYISRTAKEANQKQLEELEYKLKKRKEQREGYIFRSKRRQTEGALNFKSCTFLPVTQVFGKDKGIKVKHSFHQPMISKQEKTRIFLSRLSRVFTEAAGYLDRLIKSSRFLVNQEEADSFRKASRALRGIIEFTGCGNSDAELEIIFRKYFTDRSITSKNKNITEFKLFMLRKVHNIPILDLLRVKLEKLSKKGNYRKAGHKTSELKEDLETLTRLAKYFQRGSNWAEVITEDSLKKAK